MNFEYVSYTNKNGKFEQIIPKFRLYPQKSNYAMNIHYLTQPQTEQAGFEIPDETDIVYAAYVFIQ